MLLPKIFAVAPSYRALEIFRKLAGRGPLAWDDHILMQLTAFVRALRKHEGGEWEVRALLVPGKRQIHKLFVREPGGAWWYFEGQLATRPGRGYRPQPGTVSGGLDLVEGLDVDPSARALWDAAQLVREAARRS